MARLGVIEQSLQAKSVLQPQERKKAKSEKAGATGKFRALLETEQVQQAALQSEAPQQYDELQDFLQEIVEVGQRLQKAPTNQTLRHYRVLVQSFLKKVVNSLYELDESLGRLNIGTGQRKKYAIIRMVDGKLNELLNLVLGEQHQNLQVLARIEQINGLLVDLLS